MDTEMYANFDKETGDEMVKTFPLETLSAIYIPITS